MSEQSRSTAEAVQAVLLYVEAPKDVGEVLAPVTDDDLDLPMQEVVVPVEGHRIGVRLVAEPLDADGALGFAASISPVRSYVEPVLTGHRAFVVVSVPVVTDIFEAHHTLASMVAGLSDHESAKAVFLPRQDALTTDVLYAGEGEQRSSQNWFRVHAMKLDDDTAVAFTRGLADFGGIDVQLVATGASPADLFTSLREAVCDVLEAKQVPVAGEPLTVAGVPHLATTAEGVVGGPVLDLRPASAA